MQSMKFKKKKKKKKTIMMGKNSIENTLVERKPTSELPGNHGNGV